MELWYTEKQTENFGITAKISETHVTEKTDFQDLAMIETSEWGTMLAEAREFILRAWWVVTFPGLAILITVLAINLMGDGLRDALDPRLKRS